MFEFSGRFIRIKIAEILVQCIPPYFYRKTTVLRVRLYSNSMEWKTSRALEASSKLARQVEPTLMHLLLVNMYYQSREFYESLHVRQSRMGRKELVIDRIVCSPLNISSGECLLFSQLFENSLRTVDIIRRLRSVIYIICVHCC